MTAPVRTPTPQTAVLSPAAADLCALHLAPVMAIVDPAVRLSALTELGDALAELGRAVAEERGYAIAALRLPGEGVRPLARRLCLDESRVRQLLRLIEGAETDSAPRGNDRIIRQRRTPPHLQVGVSTKEVR